MYKGIGYKASHIYNIALGENNCQLLWFAIVFTQRRIQECVEGAAEKGGGGHRLEMTGVRAGNLGQQASWMGGGGAKNTCQTLLNNCNQEI